MRPVIGLSSKRGNIATERRAGCLGLEVGVKVRFKSVLAAALLAALPVFSNGASAITLIPVAAKAASDLTLLGGSHITTTKVSDKRRARRGKARAKRRAHRRHYRRHGRRHRDGLYIGTYRSYNPWFYGPYYYAPYHYDPFYDYPYYGYTYDDSPRLSCKRIRRLLGRQGYRKLRAYDCKGRVYGFYAKYRGKKYKLRVNAYTAHVKSKRRY